MMFLTAQLSMSDADFALMLGVFSPRSGAFHEVTLPLPGISELPARAE